MTCKKTTSSCFLKARRRDRGLEFVRWTVTLEGKVASGVSRVRSEMVNLEARREGMSGGPMLPDAPIRRAFLISVRYG
jgi:hypothetical protein